MKNPPPIDTRFAAGQGGAAGPGTRRAVVLLSGGLDSATAAAWAIAEGFTLTALSIAYGQRHAVELEAARDVARSLGIVDHVELAVDLAAFGASVLVDLAAAVPKGRSDAEIAHGIPATYVPARNTVFLSLALALAEARGAEAIVLGVNAIDYSGYPDCRPEYLAAFESLARLATKAGVEGHAPRIVAPLVSLSKAEIIRLGQVLGVDYRLTTSCYDPAPGGRPCGACDSCLLRAAGFAAAGLVDPRGVMGGVDGGGDGGVVR
jgi:7-cyano-7-deazaguanine synthase